MAQLISIAGLIGVGKTTLATGLANQLGGKLVLEAFAENPFLKDQYTNKADNGLASELFFLVSRMHQLSREAFGEDDLLVTDYIFEKSRFFAEIFLDPQQYAIFKEVFEAFAKQIIAPTMIIYLKDTVDNCMARIKSRGRDFEQSLSKEWLETLDQYYIERFKRVERATVIKIDCSAIDLREDSSVAHVIRLVNKGRKVIVEI